MKTISTETMKAMLSFDMAVYRYACFLYDERGQGLGGWYPDESTSVQDLNGNWILKDCYGRRMGFVSDDGNVSTI